MKIELSNNKRKCGIVTFHSAYNYGSVLQSYAMVMTMKNLGLDAEIIDFRHPHTTDMYEWRLWTPYKNWKWNLKDFILRGIFGIGKNREKVFRNFIETKLPLSQRVTNRNEISPYKYDVLVCGSDQIWNLASSGENDPIYFLDFGKTKCKFSYAASAGNSKFSPTEHDIYLRYLKNLKSIGVREQFLKDYIKDEFNLDSEVNPDPTFLLKAKEWEKLENKYFGMPKHYLLVYTLLKADETLAFAQKVGKKLKLPVVNICNTRGLRGKSSENVDFNLMDVSPQQFLWLFHHASFVVTNTFHGNMFSIIFRKSFVHYESNICDSRIMTLHNALGLDKTRILKDVDGLQDIDVHYDKLEPFIENYVNKGIRYIMKNIS